MTPRQSCSISSPSFSIASSECGSPPRHLLYFPSLSPPGWLGGRITVDWDGQQRLICHCQLPLAALSGCDIRPRFVVLLCSQPRGLTDDLKDGRTAIPDFMFAFFHVVSGSFRLRLSNDLSSPMNGPPDRATDWYTSSSSTFSFAVRRV